MPNTKYFLPATIYTLFLLTHALQAQEGVVSGRITGTSGESLPYANVIIAGQARGTSTNIDGEYRLSLPYGTYELVFQYIGYQRQSRKVTINADNIVVDVSLAEQVITLKEAVVLADAEDPAYEIIRQAQAKRKTYKDAFPQQSSKAYTRLFGKADGFASGQVTVFGARMDVAKGVFYLSETFSTIRKDKSKELEEITASLVVGDSSALSANKSVFVNFYNNRSLTANQTRLVSPIAADAMNFYDYRFEGSFTEDGETVNKIELLPKSDGVPAFEGYIYILEDSWRLYGLDLNASGQAVGNIGTIKLKVSYTPFIQQNTWVPFSVDLQLLSERYQVRYYSLFTDFKPTADLTGEPFNLRLRIAEGANKQTAEFWEQERPIPLTSAERLAYIGAPKPTFQVADGSNTSSANEKLDSLSWESIPESARFKIPWNAPADTPIKSSPAETAPTEANNIQSIKRWSRIARYTVGNPAIKMGSKLTLTHNNLLETFTYNLVEGLVFKINPRLSYKSEGGKEHKFEADARYGLSGKRLYGQLKAMFQLNPNRLEQLTLSGGHYLRQYAGTEVITPYLNAVYTLFSEQNYMKLYEQTYAKAGYKTTFFSQIDLTLAGEVARRRPLENSTNFRFTDVADRSFTPNQPIINGQPTNFAAHTAYLADAWLTFYLDRPYELRGKQKKYLPSSLPVLSLAYRQGMGDVDFRQWHANLRWTTRLGLVGRSKISLTYGDFISQAQITPIDFFHFAGNRTFNLQDQQTFGLAYQLLDYYGYSTTDAFFGANYQHRFEGAVMGKLPLLKKLGWQLVLSANYLQTNRLDNYVEVGAGLENILGIFRFDYFRSVGSRAGSIAGFRLSLPIN